MFTVGDIFPDFNLLALRGGNAAGMSPDDAFINITNLSHGGMWRVVFFYPKDFTFVCPTEIAGFGKRYDDFRSRKTEVLACSIDSEFVHLAWRKENLMLRDIPFPMLSDIKRELSSILGILDPVSGVANRAVFIIDPEQTIKFVMVTAMDIGRNVDEVIRVIDALQSGGLCACGWNKGDKNLTAE